MLPACRTPGELMRRFPWQKTLRLTSICETQPGWIEEVSAHGDHYLS